MLVDEDSEEECKEESATEEGVHDPMGSAAAEIAALSLNSFNDCSSAKTLKVKGTINEREAIILVDNDASHNFISSTLVKEMGLPRDLTVRHKIQVGNGMIFQQGGVFRSMHVLIQGHRVIENFFPFELVNVDLVLGVTWLKTLGEVRADWTQFTLKFLAGNQWVCLQGDTALCCTKVSVRSIFRSFPGCYSKLGWRLPRNMASQPRRYHMSWPVYLTNSS